jgi:hypothetical protein
VNPEPHAFGNHAGGSVIRKKQGIRMARHQDQPIRFAAIQGKDSAHDREMFFQGGSRFEQPVLDFRIPGANRHATLRLRLHVLLNLI